MAKTPSGLSRARIPLTGLDSYLPSRLPGLPLDVLPVSGGRRHVDPSEISSVCLSTLRAIGTLSDVSYPARLLSPDEQIIESFRPHWVVLAWPIFSAVIVVAVAVSAGLWLDDPARWIIIVGAVVVWVVASIRRVLEWMTTQYVITNERVIYRAGILSRHGKEIPLEVINDVAFSQTLLERLFRSGDLLIESAGEMGQSRYTNIPDPEGMQSIIYQARENRMIAIKSNNRSTASELESLARLRDQGVISDEDFERQKRKIIDQG